MNITTIILGFALLVAIIYIIRRLALGGAASIELKDAHDAVMPRIVNSSFLERARSSYPDGLPSRPLFQTGLSVVYVVDSKRDMAFVRESSMQSANLSEPELYALAMKNLSARYPENLVRKVLADNLLLVLKTFDGFDAARLLLIPSQLEPTQALAVTIPDRDTLSLSRPPPDDQWSPLLAAAQSPIGDGLCPMPLLVTCDAIVIKGAQTT